VKTESQPKQGIKDERFIALSNGIVKDTKTNLEWFVGPDEDTSFFEAKEWAEDLTIGGGKWRLPSVEELKSLSQRRGGVTTIHPFFMTNGKSIWASNQWTADLYIINRNKPAEFLIESYLTKSVFKRAFAVRSRK
jgi:hypothetical protein